MDHTEASATASAASRIRATAAETRCRGVAIAVMRPTQAPGTDSRRPQNPLSTRDPGISKVKSSARFPCTGAAFVLPALDTLPPGWPRRLDSLAPRPPAGRERGGDATHPPAVPA